MSQRVREISVCILWFAAVALSGAYAIRQGQGSDELFLAMLTGSLVALGTYDTRRNQPTQYNLLRSWPFGTPADDDSRGARTLPSHALHGMLWISVWLCLCQILYGHR
ncbi:MAG TPA: hypothetical protein VNZ06_07055 [Steroidobacteraceae bacterium]|jgi:hypothetical protein|nr:hypothetical protein [Steroidobacteraceae bacterium]